MMQSMIKKLRGKSGESIGETLIALLISALALMMLAGAVSTVASLVSRSNATMNEYYTSDNELVTRNGTSTTFSIKLGDKYSYQATGYENATFAGTPVIAYDAKSSSSGG